MRQVLASIVCLALLLLNPRVSAAQCIGDCNGDDAVTVSELITLINIVLGNQQPSACPIDCGGTILDISCLVSVLRNALDGCPPPNVPALTASVPAAGASDVARSALIRLEFASPVDPAELAGVEVVCGETSLPTVVSALSASSVVVNPTGDLVPGAACAVVGLGDNQLSFTIAAAGAPATILYDRGDPERTSPFPDDYWTTTDPGTHAGRRVAMPVPEGGSDLQDIYGGLLAEVNKLDGFSPVAHIVVELSDAPDPTTLPRTPAESLDPLASIALIDITQDEPTRGQRIPFRVDVRTDTSFAGFTTHSLLIFPSIPLQQLHRYGLVVTRRVLVDPSRPFEAGAAYLGNLRAQSLADEVAAVSATLTPPIPGDDVALALSISIRSLDVIANDPLAIKAQVMAAPPPAFTITSVVPDTTSATVAAIVSGTWQAPDWRGGSRRHFERDANGVPVQTRTKAIPFTLALPVAALDGPVPIAMYQHGNPGSSEREVPSAARRSLAAAGFAVIGFTDVLNRELSMGATDTQQAILAQTAPVLASIVEDQKIPDFWAETRGEMLAFLRFIDGLGELDVLPVGAPDGVPELDMTTPRVYLGISEGGNNAQGFLPYAPEIKAGAIMVGGARLAEVLIHQAADIFLGILGAVFQSMDPTDIWVAMSLFQTAYDRQDPHNHARFLYRDRLEVAGTTRKPSVLLVEGLDDGLVPNHATDSLAWSAGPLPHLMPVQRAVPFLQVVEGPIQANIDAETTAAFYQYVPDDTPGLITTPGCEGEPEGHYCAQRAPISLRQRAVFFQSALTGVPVIIDPLSDETGPTVPMSFEPLAH